MFFYDISQEVFTCSVYPGDPAPERIELMKTSKGELVNLTAIHMCAHNGTHVDAPYHFYGDGKTIDQIKLEKFNGLCFVTRFDGTLSGADAEAILKKAHEENPDSEKKIILKGSAVVSEEAAEVFASHKIDLIGNESQTVGSLEGPAKVHYILLKEEVVLLEGIRVEQVPEGVYFLNSAPLNLGGADGSPCRAWLMKM